MHTMSPTAIQDWFDINDSKHLHALAYFQEKGRWPSKFLPRNVKVFKGSVSMLHTMILRAWSEERIRVGQLENMSKLS